MTIASLYQTFNRYKTLQTHRISSLPIVILMPHSACNCRCVMCDIWKGNRQLKQLTEADIAGLLTSLKRFGTRQVLMSGGEALLHPGFFRFCELLRELGIKVSLLTTGLTLSKHAASVAKWVSDITVSLDGDELLHDAIRNLPGAYKKMKEGIVALRSIDPYFPITGRSVIHRLNFQHWPAIIDAAKELQLDSISFLPADVSSTAFNRAIGWSEPKQHEILLSEQDLPSMKIILEEICARYIYAFDSGFIAESPAKLKKIYYYYAAYYGRNDFPYKKCNAPWVSTVIEPDGSVRPCFFHKPLGNIRSLSLDAVLNSDEAIDFRRTLDMDTNDTCRKCVCFLNLPPGKNIS